MACRPNADRAPSDTERLVPFISVVTACHNEEENVEEIARQVRAVMESYYAGRGRFCHSGRC